VAVVDDNPLSRVYAALWDVLLQEREIERWVPPAARVRFDEARDPRQPRVLDADLPELTLVPAGSEGAITGTTTHLAVTEVYDLVLRSHDLQLQRDVFPLRWAVIRALWRTPDLGLSFVRRIGLSGQTLRFVESERGRPAWEFSLRITVELYLSREGVERPS